LRTLLTRSKLPGEASSQYIIILHGASKRGGEAATAISKAFPNKGHVDSNMLRRANGLNVSYSRLPPPCVGTAIFCSGAPKVVGVKANVRTCRRMLHLDVATSSSSGASLSFLQWYTECVFSCVVWGVWFGWGLCV
jgi:hypothetical protein